jgi:phosphatidate cytidylyltransferase
MFFTQISTLEWIGFALVIIIFGTFGDLIESMFKRTFEIKDSGSIMPGHGGILDRLDSILLAAPFALVYVVFVLN